MLCMLKHTLFSCVYAKGVFSIHKITTASICNKTLGLLCSISWFQFTQNQVIYNKKQSNKSFITSDISSFIKFSLGKDHKPYLTNTNSNTSCISNLLQPIFERATASDPLHSKCLCIVLLILDGLHINKTFHICKIYSVHTIIVAYIATNTRLQKLLIYLV